MFEGKKVIPEITEKFFCAFVFDSRKVKGYENRKTIVTNAAKRNFLNDRPKCWEMPEEATITFDYSEQAMVACTADGPSVISIGPNKFLPTKNEEEPLKLCAAIGTFYVPVRVIEGEAEC